MTKSTRASSSRYSPFPLLPKLPSRLRGMGLRDSGAGMNHRPCSQQYKPHPGDAEQEADPPPSVKRVGGPPELRAIDIEDLPLSASPIQQFASLPLFSERAREQIIEKEGT